MVGKPGFRAGLVLIALLMSVPRAGRAQESLDEWAVELINPVSGVGIIHNDINYLRYQGDLPEAGDQYRLGYQLTASIPFRLDNGRNIIVRGGLPISFGTPTYITEEDDMADWLIRQRADTIDRDGYFIDGHGHAEDISYDVAYGGVSETGFLSMYGIAGVFPNSQDGSIERDQFLLGPEIALGQVTSWGIYGGWLKHLTNVANISPKKYPYDTNETTLQIFFAYGLGNGWQVVSNPLITWDWEGASDNRLLLPIGGGVSKTVRWGRVPMRLAAEIYYYAESPEAFGPEWELNFRFSPALWGRR